MILYPTTVLFQMTCAIQHALRNLHERRRMNPQRAVSMTEFETIVDLPKWAVIENRFRSGPIAKVRSFFDKFAA